LREIQLHKDTFDGCLAGASAQWWTHLNYATYAVNRYVNRLNSTGFLNSTDYALIGKEVLQQCDELDGVKDGIILNPRICKPDLSNLICAGAKEDGCLIKEQADTMYEIWSNRTRESTGEWLFPGFEPGSEASPAFSVTGVPYVSWLRLGARFPLETATDLVFSNDRDLDPTFSTIRSSTGPPFSLSTSPALSSRTCFFPSPMRSTTPTPLTATSPPTSSAESFSPMWEWLTRLFRADQRFVSSL